MRTQREKRRPALRLVSAPAKPEVVFAVEPFYVIARELPPLFRKHWRELGRDREAVPLDADWDHFMQVSVAGKLKIITARLATTNELVGYVFNLVGPHSHYRSTLHSMVDMYWLDPRFRVGWIGYKMLRRNEEELDKLGVVRRSIAERVGFKGRRGRLVRAMFKRLGYKPRDIVYTKVRD